MTDDAPGHDDDQPTLPGKHRRNAAANTWTPVVDPHASSTRHHAEPSSSPVTGSLDALGQAGRWTEPARREHTGELPVPGLAPADASPVDSSHTHLDEQFASELAGELTQPATAVGAATGAEYTPADNESSREQADSGMSVPAGVPASPSEQQPTRTKITLIPPTQPQEERRVYTAPPPDGLGSFDLGSVPASVTPPRSWRTAAWFATMSSGGVVVALLIAGSHFVGPPTDRLADDGWPGLRGEQPEFQHNDPHVAPTRTDEPEGSQDLEDSADEGPDSGSDDFEGPEGSEGSAGSEGSEPASEPDRLNDLAGIRTHDEDASTPHEEPPAEQTETRHDDPETNTPSATTTQPPQKPSPSPAERETHEAPFSSFSSTDPETMGDRSEIFLNEITENPERAHEQTGGELYEEGAETIAERYSDVAYFEVEHVRIDQEQRTTVNTVHVVWMDGTTTDEQRTLRFEDGDKITSD